MKICIIGQSGHWSYINKELDNHNIVGVCGGFDGENMTGVINSLEKKNIHTTLFDSFEALLEQKPDIAVINTRFDLNSYYTIECLKRNIYVFSEKPLATSLEDLESIRKIGTEAGKFFVSAMFGISFEPWWETVKAAVKDIGEIRMMNARKSYKLGTRPDFYKNRDTFGGIIPWVAIHAIHWIYASSGLKFKSVMATANNQVNFGHGDLETSSACIFTMENGAIATVTADYFRPSGAATHDDDRIRLVGTKGILECQCGKVTLIDENGSRELPLLPERNVFSLFLKRVAGSDEGVSMEESLYITEVALKARLASDTHSTIEI